MTHLATQVQSTRATATTPTRTALPTLTVEGTIRMDLATMTTTTLVADTPKIEMSPPTLAITQIAPLVPRAETINLTRTVNVPSLGMETPRGTRMIIGDLPTMTDTTKMTVSALAPISITCQECQN